MRLTGLHLLLTYQCTWECDHCFVWSGPKQTGTLTLGRLRNVLEQGRDLGGVEWIFFEGGEPFLYYTLLLAGSRRAKELGFSVGLVTNGYWATSTDDAEEALQPFVGALDLVQVSDDEFHGGEQAARARAAAECLGIASGSIRIAAGEGLQYRGRAAETLAPAAPPGHPWDSFTECPHEDLLDPSRVHVDPLGWVHLCQGIVIGNLFETPLRELCDRFDPRREPLFRALVEGGPAGVVREFGLDPPAHAADACHLCYTARHRLRERFPRLLAPDQMYGEGASLSIHPRGPTAGG